MKKLLKTLFFVSILVVAMTACKREKPSCQKVVYQMDGINVITYQWMTQEEAEATFSKYNNVKIYHFEEDQTDCLIKNLE